MAVARISRHLPAFMAVAVGIALRKPIIKLTIAMMYLRPALIKARDERERQAIVKKIREELDESKENR
jgi:hypothetical protein